MNRPALDGQVWTECLIALGSNLGDRGQSLGRAVDWLGHLPGLLILSTSRWHETQPIGGGPQPGFLNGAVLATTTLAPQRLLEELLAIEERLGRRRERRWGPRSADLDLLLYGSRTIDEPALSVPHPRMTYRPFVLDPAAEVAADFVHPTTGLTVEQLRNRLRTTRPYMAVAGVDSGIKRRLVAQTVSAFSPHVVEINHASEMQDASGGTRPARLECWCRALEHLSPANPPWSQNGRLWISDFWTEELLAQARCETSPWRQTYQQQWQAAAGNVVEPRLAVLAPFGSGAGSVAEPRREILAAELRRLAREPGHGPVLDLSAASEEQALTEILAAVEAMA